MAEATIQVTEQAVARIRQILGKEKLAPSAGLRLAV